MVSREGGVPLLSETWSGHTTGTVLFKERAEALIDEFKNTGSPRYPIADSKRYTQENTRIIKQIS